MYNKFLILKEGVWGNVVLPEGKVQKETVGFL